MIQYQKNPKRSSKIIEVDGKKYESLYIGKGMFSKVYRVGDRVVYYTEGDCGKEVLAMFQYNRMMHLPEIIRHDNILSKNEYLYVFSSPYYRNVTLKDRLVYELMSRIMFVESEIFKMINSSSFRGTNLDLMQNIVVYMREYRDIPRSIINALQEIVNVASNCGDKVMFDLNKNNFGVNDYGVLIFRDPIYVKT